MGKKQGWGEMDKSNTPFAKLRTAYRLYNQTTNKSPRTIHWYDERLRLFAEFIGAGASLKDVNIETVRAYIADLQGRTERYANNAFHPHKEGGLSSSYIQGFARALRAFASWLHEDGYTATNVLKNLKPPKIQQKVIEPLTDREIEALLATFDRADPFGARNYAMAFLMLDCGLRASELVGLPAADAHVAEGFLKVLGKGNKERLVPIGRRSQDALVIWRDRFRPQFDPDNTQLWFFLNANSQMVTVRSLEELVAKAGNLAGIIKLHPHRLRHTFATRFLTNGLGDTLQLQQFLGHPALKWCDATLPSPPWRRPSLSGIPRRWTCSAMPTRPQTTLTRAESRQQSHES